MFLSESDGEKNLATTRTEGKDAKSLHIEHNFPINSSKFSSDSFVKSLTTRLDSIASVDSLAKVDIHGLASIDGPTMRNDSLALCRALEVKSWIETHTRINPSLISTKSDGEDWVIFRQLVENDRNIPSQKEALGIIDLAADADRRETMLRSLDNGATWEYLATAVFPLMRRTSIDILWNEPTVEPFSEPEILTPIIEESINEEKETALSVAPSEIIETFIPRLYIKTNLPAWAMLWSNVAVEADVAPHWSVALPYYYSGWNYFKRTLKFRTRAIVPEARYWFRSSNMGFFLNIHAGCAWYDYAKDGAYRYQDHRGRTPALGGGIGTGFRFYVSRDRKWTMEAAIGCGLYHLDYDIYENRTNGFLIGREKRNFFGIDQAAFSIAYSFGLKKEKQKEGGAK